MKYFLLGFGIILLNGCGMNMQTVEHMVNTCKAAGGEPIVVTMREGFVDYVRCKKDGAVYRNWEGKYK